MSIKILSGIQPSGNMHIGNYLGSIRQWLLFSEVNAAQRQHRLNTPFQLHFFIADLHCLTTPSTLYAASLGHNITHCYLSIIACGLDPEHNNIYLQSKIKSLGKFYFLLNCITSASKLNRMHHWKQKKDSKGGKVKYKVMDKSDKSGMEDMEVVGSDLGDNVGLLSQPALMAADILSFKPDFVPVGEDQIQHLNYTNDLVHELNRVSKNSINFGMVNRPGILKDINDILVQQSDLEQKRSYDPINSTYVSNKHNYKIEDYINIKIQSLKDPTKKMSKSDEKSYISLHHSNDQINKIVKSAKTDSLGEINDELSNREGVINMINIISLINNESFDDCHKKYLGKNVVDIKSDLIEVLIQLIEPKRNLYQQLINEKQYFINILNDNSNRLSNEFEEFQNEIESKIQN